MASDVGGLKAFQVLEDEQPSDELKAIATRKLRMIVLLPAATFTLAGASTILLDA
jgi:hypothetical protein